MTLDDDDDDDDDWERKQAKSYKLIFVDISRAHFHSPTRR